MLPDQKVERLSFLNILKRSRQFAEKIRNSASEVVLWAGAMDGGVALYTFVQGFDVPQLMAHLLGDIPLLLSRDNLNVLGEKGGAIIRKLNIANGVVGIGTVGLAYSGEHMLAMGVGAASTATAIALRKVAYKGRPSNIVQFPVIDK